MLTYDAASRVRASTPLPVPPRKLDSRHFAFMRALAQGLDERASWDRYLRVEGEHTDSRTVRRTIAWIRDEFAAAAKRERRPGIARLIQLDPDRIAREQTVPSLADFAAERGLEDFSQAEQIEAFEAAYPNGKAKSQPQRSSESRRARVIARQLEAIQWLQDLVAQRPRPEDDVSAWLHPVLAGRLEAAGLRTLRDLVERVNARGPRWWRGTPAIGAVKAARIVDWLQHHGPALGLALAPHAAVPRRELGRAMMDAVRPPATCIAPFEKFVLPSRLNGSAGPFRAPASTCLLAAENDYEAIDAWLQSKASGARQGALTSTQRSYRKEAERLLLWAVLVREMPLSAVDAEDVQAFRRFLEDPPATWCGPRHHQRWSLQWRPLEGPLSPAAIRQSMIILRSLFTFLVANRYLVASPFATVVLPPDHQRAVGRTRCFRDDEWRHLVALLRTRNATAADRRLGRGLRWLRDTGLGLSELVDARCGHLRPATTTEPGGAWQLEVKGRGGRSRYVRIPQALIDELSTELVRCGLAPQVDAAAHRDIPILGRFEAMAHSARPWTTSGLYQAVKAFLSEAADTAAAEDAPRLRAASAHWMRRTHRLRGDTLR